MNMKNNYLLKSCWNEPIKNKITLLSTTLHFLLKKERKTPVDIIILHLCTKSLNDKICSSWDIECDRLKLVPFYYLKNLKYKNSEIMKQEWDTKFFVIFDLFWPFTYDPEKQKFETMKKTSGDIIILHVCTIDYDHMMYSSFDMVREWRMDR